MISSDVSKLSRPAPIDETPGEAFNKLLKKHKISTAEYERIRKIMGRAPTFAELGVFSAMWSEHCSYKSSRVHLKRFPTEGPEVVVGPGENAGVVRLSGKLCAAFKMESHNHPSYIEPYQGAATGVGGILRDVFCMGARPVANLNALRFGEKDHPRTHYLVEHCVKGIGDYGNCIGVPTVGGNISFDASYNGNCLVNAMTVGLIHEDKIFKGFASGVGNLVVYLGSATGRDGIHGATMASDSFATADASERSTVQVGDPFTEKLLLEATLEVLEKGLVVGLQDMGAAGLTSSSFEMAGRAGNGLFMDLDRVPVRTTAMTAYELLLSESQERMLMVIKPENWEPLKKVLEKWQLACDVIGTVTDTGRVHVSHQGKLEVDMPVDPITEEAPKYERPIKPRAKPSVSGATVDAHAATGIGMGGAANLLQGMLRDTGDKTPVFRQYDQHIGAKTVQSSTDHGAAVLWVRSEWANPGDENLGLLTTATCNERYCRLDPRQGAAHAVLRSARMISAAGGTPLAITDCLNYGNPEDPEVMWDFSQGVDGIADACRELGVQVVSGNVSLYNETDGQSIAPTPMIGMVGKMKDVRKALKAKVSEDCELFFLAPRDAKPFFSASLAARHLGLGVRDGELPTVNWAAERESMTFLRRLSELGLPLAARDVGAGGVALTVAKMTVDAGLGVSADLGSDAGRAYGEYHGAYILALKGEKAQAAVREAAALSHNTLLRLGKVEGSGRLDFGSFQVPVDKAQSAHRAAMIAATEH